MHSDEKIDCVSDAQRLCGIAYINGCSPAERQEGIHFCHIIGKVHAVMVVLYLRQILSVIRAINSELVGLPLPVLIV